MSINGDSCSVRGGRATCSIYDYPEHLNPFYEDENHKRLRFWNIGKGNSAQNGRRNSFSLGGLKEMWAFKSFRLKKKSSSLGINKTSESPPALRRQLPAGEVHYGTYDPRMRHTTNSNGFGSGFERNVPYRSSLQDMSSASQTLNRNGFGFERNDRYRSTIQTPAQPPVASRRYVYGGSVTPQPARSDRYSQEGNMSRGSSQISVASTNPFDDDEDDNNDVVIGQMPNGTSTPSKRPRKKRRAPPPPVPQAISEENTPNPSPEKTRADEDNLAISNLTAEIESFVKSSNETADELRITEKPAEVVNEMEVSPTKKQQPVEVTSTTIKQQSCNYNSPILTEKSVKVETVVISSGSPAETKVSVVETSPKIESVVVSEEKPTTVVETSPIAVKRTVKVTEKHKSKVSFAETTPEVVSNSVEVVSVEKQTKNQDTTETSTEIVKNSKPKVAEKPQKVHKTIPADFEADETITIVQTLDSIPEIIISSAPLSIVEETVDATEPESVKNKEKEYDIEDIPLPTPVTKIEPIVEENNNSLAEACISEDENEVELPPIALKITEPRAESRSPVEIVPITIRSVIVPKPVVDPFSRYSSRRQLTFQDDRHKSTENITQTKRSVKDIIESINQSQSLLRINQEATEQEGCTVPTSRGTEFRSLEESERQIKKMLKELDKPLNVDESKVKNNEDNINGILDDLADSINNNYMSDSNSFKKCIVKTEISLSRESSPTSSNLDWNPVPKPKRTKNFSPEIKLSNKVDEN